MKLLITSDTHIGITKPETLRRMLIDSAETGPDIFIHGGDYSGGYNGHKPLSLTCAMIRDVFPEIPVVTVMGNHDYWTSCSSGSGIPKNSSASFKKFFDNYECIKETFRKHKFHFLDCDGVYRNPLFPGTAFVGHTGWYVDPNDKTSNDWYFIPSGIKENTQNFLLTQAFINLKKNLSSLDDSDTVRIFISHFPVKKNISFGLVRGWDTRLYPLLHDKYKISYFIQGHFHERHEGPGLWEAGSDYEKPRYLLLEI